MPKLTEVQKEEVLKELVPESKGVPVRFQLDGRTMDIITGELQPKSINVIYQNFYWRFSRETSLKIAKWLGVEAIFSK